MYFRRGESSPTGALRGPSGTPRTPKPETFLKSIESPGAPPGAERRTSPELPGTARSAPEARSEVINLFRKNQQNASFSAPASLPPVPGFSTERLKNYFRRGGPSPAGPPPGPHRGPRAPRPETFCKSIESPGGPPGLGVGKTDNMLGLGTLILSCIFRILS